MIEVVQYNDIRIMAFNEGLSQRAIAEKLGIHRETVKRALARDEHGYQLTVDRPKPVNDEFEERIKEMLIENSYRQRKDRLTKTRMHELMCEEGYKGSYSSFTHLVRQIESSEELKSKEAFFKLAPIPGTLQVDFGDMVVMDNGIPKVIQVFCAKLTTSKSEFIKSYPRQSTEFFFDGLNSAFIFYGGIPKRIVFDNLKQAVKEIKTEKERILQERFLRFSAYYAFEAIFCNPSRGNEKGLVENLVKYTRNNYFKPRVNFEGFDKLNKDLLAHCHKRMVKNNWYPALRTEVESSFMELKEVYNPATLVMAKVNTYSLVHVDSNRYSVPTQHVGRRVNVHIFPFEIKVYYQQELIATHTRLFGKNKDSLEPLHFLELLRQKPGAIQDAQVMKDWKLAPIFEAYHNQLQCRRESKSKGTREYIEILNLIKTCGMSKVKAALVELDKTNCYGYEAVVSKLRLGDQSETIKNLDYQILVERNLHTIHSPVVKASSYDFLLREGVN
ncbi:IS21 family transposase [Alkalicella caledoniensis]|uniref:IS21 family transposase n=1 Tax=Alkalicella caledoniensis TaxID=2731377 RepID=A0A7G9W4X4_ALKCA|nr:IS21 family transposase [Alkalicella caledoniensis]QNO13736.1 IS21 family transposase [Alkalicella caledoniensis]